MQTEQADARLSFFELAASGDVMKLSLIHI